jgi:UDP-glucose:(heptosyl)LPS alpha-1,3-glucosyltransferase
MCNSDICLHPALFDPYPNAVMEAMACGLLVLGSDATGVVVDRIVDGINGFSHPAARVDILAEQIARALVSPDLIREIGLNARRTAEEWPIDRAHQILSHVLSLNGLWVSR